MSNYLATLAFSADTINMDKPTSFANHFLIAMPNLADPYFAHTVTYVCEHNESGAIGIIINRPLGIKLSDVLENMDIKNNNPATHKAPILFGGPLHQERGFVIHRPGGKWRSTFLTPQGIGITTSRDILQAIGEGKGPEEMIVSLGCSGWGAGQLEQEIATNFWLNSPVNPTVLFQTPYEGRWQAAAALLGININSLSGESGHG